MINFPRLARKSVAVLLAVSLPGEAFAQVIGRAVTPAGSAVASPLPLTGPSFTPLSAPGLSALSLSAPALNSLAVPAPALGALAAPAALQPVQAAPETSQIPVTAVAAARSLGARLDAAKMSPSPDAAAPALEAFYPGSAAATPDEPVAGADGVKP
ncbi:MAG: hypothetical protein ABL955_13520, partial [Elusimicrobiota bacterium]